MTIQSIHSFWQYGKWIDVVVDDRLPTINGKLIYMCSTDKNEFWSALLEKAYAKLLGSYEALKGGSTCEAHQDFTGGITEMYNLREAPENLFQVLEKAFERNSLVGCSIDPDPKVVEAKTPQGLIKGHAYTVTKVAMVNIKTPNTTGKIPLLRIRNPWGNEAEWNGAWSDKAPEWQFIELDTKTGIGLSFEHDGEFWMSFQDFLKYFSEIEICNLSPDSLVEDPKKSINKSWSLNTFEGDWVPGVSAGGCLNNPTTFHTNPQYVMNLNEADKNDDKCSVVIALLQKHRRSRRHVGLDLLGIGFQVYQLKDSDLAKKPQPLNFFKYTKVAAKYPVYINMREVSCRFKLPPGNFLIIPSTFAPNEDGEFMIRVFSEKTNTLKENDETISIGEIDKRVSNFLI